MRQPTLKKYGDRENVRDYSATSRMKLFLNGTARGLAGVEQRDSVVLGVSPMNNCLKTGF
ncbi:hypothetical protein [Pleurocapsa sp. FMAR1]|uniref:hypothetical protein n=1 Tax=Pleurocapsa sp. FMAR1 TaxID=3040204 RepID=UPI0029C98224|nr:hypothetical protein [Pleurocapsa sp. FMAR1]